MSMDSGSCGNTTEQPEGPSQLKLGVSLLLALCGEKHDLSVKEVPLSASALNEVTEAFLSQEAAFCDGQEVAFNENWLNEYDEIATSPRLADVPVFENILRSTDTSLAPIDSRNLDEIRGLTIKANDAGRDRILVQLFAASQSLSRPSLISLLFERGTYTRLESSGFRLNDKLVCIVEDGMIKFRSLHNLGRVVDTSAIFRTATDREVSSFTADYSNLFEIPDVDGFVSRTSRNARKYMTSLAKSGVLRNHTAQTLLDASIHTRLEIKIRNGKIVMPSKSGEITELMRFLNDGRYVGPVSGNAFIANSRRPVT